VLTYHAARRTRAQQWKQQLSQVEVPHMVCAERQLEPIGRVLRLGIHSSKEAGVQDEEVHG
jgi:hypothetical protein